MKYRVWDNDKATNVCYTDDRKEAFAQILNHLIMNDDPVLWPVFGFNETNFCLDLSDSKSVLVQAKRAYKAIIGEIPA